MKNFFFPIPVFILLISSCSQQKETQIIDKFANKAVSELGSGKYASEFERYIPDMHLFDDDNYYSEAEADAHFATIGEYDLTYSNNLIDTDIPFNTLEIISRTQGKMDLYLFFPYPAEYDMDIGLNREERLKLYKRFKRFTKWKKDYKVHMDENNEDKGFSYVSDKSVPVYYYRYKLDNKYTADLRIIKHPEDGLKVTYFKIVDCTE